MIIEKNGKFICIECNYVYSSILGDDEVKKICCNKTIEEDNKNDYIKR